MTENEVSREEDMSPDGKLILFQQDDGDIIVTVQESLELLGPSRASVEFCIPGTGGGGSPETHRALRDLMEAMRADDDGTTVKHDVPVASIQAMIDLIWDRHSQSDEAEHAFLVEEWLLRYKSNV